MTSLRWPADQVRFERYTLTVGHCRNSTLRLFFIHCQVSKLRLKRGSGSECRREGLKVA